MQQAIKPKSIAFLVQGLFEISDSIGFDCVYEFRVVKEALENQPEFAQVHLFCERFSPERYPGVEIEDLTAFFTWCKENPDGLVVYHYCGEWKEIDRHLVSRPAPSVVRWHNNTPPWFYMEGECSNAFHTIAGFENIVELLQGSNFFFWVNSEFTARQYLGLGGAAERLSVVYPASRYIVGSDDHRGGGSKSGFAVDGYDLLFVGRVVRHKGYKGLIAVASRLQQLVDRPVRLHLPGRIDLPYHAELVAFATEQKVDARFYGEVNESELAALYRGADVFLCLSEHEGFGLPVFEAMASGIPVVAWASTAFEDLLEGHPLAFPQFDLNVFSAAILALQDLSLRQDVIDAQTKVRARYTAEIVRGQLIDALRRVSPAAQIEALVQRFPPALRLNAPLAEQIAAKALTTRQLHSAPAKRHDSGNNLYSLYDLRIYKLFLEIQAAERNEKLRPPTPDAHVLFTPNEFSRRNGEVSQNGIIFAFDRNAKDHLTFGPYVQFPRGRYSAEFMLSAAETRTDLAIVADVAQSGRSCGEKTFGVTTSPNAKYILDFAVDADGSVVEFRIRPRGGESGRIVFAGVRVRRKQ